MNTIKQILETKGSEICTIKSDNNAFKALQIMSKHNIGSILIVNDSEEIIGIFTERDYARKVILKGKSSKNTPITELMSKNVLYVTPDDTVDSCMALMTEKCIRHLPVMEKGKLKGLISIGDVVKKIISDHEFTIKELENYISGSFGVQG